MALLPGGQVDGFDGEDLRVHQDFLGQCDFKPGQCLLGVWGEQAAARLGTAVLIQQKDFSVFPGNAGKGRPCWAAAHYYYVKLLHGMPSCLFNGFQSSPIIALRSLYHRNQGEVEYPHSFPNGHNPAASGNHILF